MPYPQFIPQIKVHGVIFSQFSSEKWIHRWASEVPLSDLCCLLFSLPGVPLEFLPCCFPSGSQPPFTFSLMGLWEGVSHPMRALKRKSSLFLANTATAFGKLLCVPLLPRCLFYLIKHPSQLGSGVRWGTLFCYMHPGTCMFFFQHLGLQTFLNQKEKASLGMG